jgi:hypothetical protein
MRWSILALALLTNLSFSSSSFGSAISSGFNSTTEAPNAGGVYDSSSLCANQYVPAAGCNGTAISLGFSVDFFGTTYNSVYINTDGAISFDAPVPNQEGLLNTSSNPFGLDGAQNDIIAPFLAGVDTTGTGTLSWGAGTFDGDQAFGVTWNAVGYEFGQTNLTDTFQVLLVDEGAGNFAIVFNYGNIQWDSSGADGGVNGTGGYSAIAGFVDGTSITPTDYELPGSSVDGAFLNGGPNALISHDLNSNVEGQYIFNFADGAPVTTPEPSTWAVMTIGFLLMIFCARRRLRTATTQE